MTIRISTGMRNAVLDNGAGTVFDSGKLTIFNGSQPGSADAAWTPGTILAQLTLNADSFGAASAGTISAGAITSDTSADATGSATWFRMHQASDTNGTVASNTAIRLDGSCGTGTGDLSFDDANIVASGTVACSGFTISLPAS